MIIGFFELNFFSFFIEYFLGITIIYILITYLFLVNNIFGLLVYRSICDCLGMTFLLICYLIFNDSLFFLTDLNQNVLTCFNQFMLFDYLSIYSKLFLSFLSFLFFIIISNLLKDYEIMSLELLILVLFVLLGLIILCSSFDLLLIFVSIEIISLSSYFLSAYYKNSVYSIESGIKYLLVGVVSSSFFLTGVVFFYYYTGSVLLFDIRILVMDFEYLFFTNNNSFLKVLVFKYDYHQYFVDVFYFKNLFFEYLLLNSYIIKSNKPLFDLGFIFLFFSICIKLSVSPFHFWSLDVYENSVSIITFFFIVITKLSYFVILFRVYNFLINKSNFILNFLFLFIGFISVLLGSFGNLKQKKIKTLLTYSSVSHMGYVFLSFSVNSPLGLETVYFYLIIYFLSNIVIWFVVLLLKKKIKKYSYKFSKDIGDMTLLSKSNKILSFGFVIVLFSIAGIPPFIGFFAKMGIFLSLISEKIISLTIATIFCSAVSTFYYIRIIKILYFENFLVGRLYYPINFQNIIIYCLLVCSLILLFINPKLLYLLLQKIIFFDTFF